jgi:hypothetical protein
VLENVPYVVSIIGQNRRIGRKSTSEMRDRKTTNRESIDSKKRKRQKEGQKVKEKEG